VFRVGRLRVPMLHQRSRPQRLWRPPCPAKPQPDYREPPTTQPLQRRPGRSALDRLARRRPLDRLPRRPVLGQARMTPLARPFLARHPRRGLARLSLARPFLARPFLARPFLDRLPRRGLLERPMESPRRRECQCLGYPEYPDRPHRGRGRQCRWLQCQRCQRLLRRHRLRRHRRHRGCHRRCGHRAVPRCCPSPSAPGQWHCAACR
jgi:hypothetical protein